MIKAWQSKEDKDDIRLDLPFKWDREGFTEIVAVITPLAKHEEVQAVLAAAEEEAIDLWICPRYISDTAPEFGCTYYIEESKRADKGKGPGCYKYSVCRAAFKKFIPHKALKKIWEVTK